jgi:antitoxin VapB
LEERLRRVGGTRQKTMLLDDLAAIRQRCAKLKVLDNRTPDDILGYNDQGLPS